MISFEFEAPHHSTCDCCGGRNTTLTRFVYADGDVHAVYYAAFSDNHEDRIVSAVLSLGEWGEDSDPTTRRAFALRLRAGPENYEVMVVGPDECAWRDSELLGPVLSREDALTHEWIAQVFHITDHILTDDAEVKGYLDGDAAPSDD